MLYLDSIFDAVLAFAGKTFMNAKAIERSHRTTAVFAFVITFVLNILMQKVNYLIEQPTPP
jgi:hypothetical protein